MNRLDRYHGSMLGLAVGDALGCTLEFKLPGTFTPITDMIGGGPFNLQPGQWTDDTAMALCLAESLVTCQGFNACDQMQRYVRWWKHGHFSCTGACFDIGTTTARALAEFVRTGNPFAGVPSGAGNGCLMRLAPVPLFFAHSPPEFFDGGVRTGPAHAIDMAGESACTTHGAAEAIDACRYFAALIVGALQGRDKHELLADHFDPTGGYWRERPLCPQIAEIAAGCFRCKSPPDVCGSGYVVASLEAALWAFNNGESFADVVLAAANLGDDADTTASIAGQLAGAYYGVGGIPDGWLGKLAMRGVIEELAGKLTQTGT